MKKLLSFVAAFLLAVVTAVGVHAADSTTSSTKGVSASADGQAVEVVTTRAAFDAADKAVLVTPATTANLPVKLDAVTVFEVETKGISGTYTLTVSNDLFGNGVAWTYYHYASDTDATVKDSATVTSSNNTLTLTLHGASPIAIVRGAANGRNVPDTSAF